MSDWQAGISIYLADDSAVSLESDAVRSVTPVGCGAIIFYARQVTGTIHRRAKDQTVSRHEISIPD